MFSSLFLLLAAFWGYCLDNPQLVGGLLGLIAPGLIEAIKQPTFTAAQRRFLSYAVAGLIGLLTVISLGQFNPADLSSTILITIAAAKVTYSEVWKPTGAAEKIGAKTTIYPTVSHRSY